MSASLASFASGWLSDRYSRKRTIMLGAYIFGAGAAIEAGSMALPMLIIGRLIVGGEFVGLLHKLCNIHWLVYSGRRFLLVGDWSVLGRNSPTRW